MLSWNIDTKISFSPFISIGEHNLEIKPNWHLIINDVDYEILKEAAICYSDVIKAYVRKNPTSNEYKLSLDINKGSYSSTIQQFFLWQPIEINNDNFPLIQALANELQISVLTSMLSVYDYLDSKADTLLTNDSSLLVNNAQLIEEIFNDSKSKKHKSPNSEIVEKADPIQLSKQLFNYCIGRPNKIEDVVDFVCKKNKLCPVFVNYVLNKYSSGSEFIQEISFIIELLLSAGKLDFSEISKLKYNHINDKNSTNALPFNLIQYAINNEKQYSITLNETLKKYPADQISIEKLSANNWELQRRLAKNGVNPAEIAVTIRNDDVQTLKSICKNPNMIINPSPYERCTYINKNVTLLQYAAFFGSLKCFLYLQMCKAKIDENDNMYKYAVCGGNSQIMKTCEPLNKPYEETLNAAIIYHRNAICNNYFANDLEVLKNCIEFDQTQVFLNFLKENSATSPESYKNSPLNEILFQVIRQNNAPFLDLMLKMYNLDLNSVEKKSNMDAIQIGTACGSIDCLKLIAQKSSESSKLLERFDPHLLRRLNDSRALTEYHLMSPRSSPKAKKFEEEKLNEKGSELTISHITSKFSQKLVKKIVDFDERNQFDNNSTLLHVAARHNHPDLIELYLNPPFSMDINAEDVYGNTALLTAAANGSVEAVSHLLRRRDINRNAKDKHDYTALHLACENKQVDVVSFLIKNGFDVNARGYFNNTPLYFAVKSGSVETTVCLLKRKDVDVNAVCDNGNTALHIAAMQNDARMVDLLLKKSGININVKNMQKKTPKEMTTKKKIIDLIDNFHQE